MRRGFGTRSEVLGRRGMAATSHPLATGIAVDVLQRGGSAVDAAIAANLLLGLVEPTGCGLGGEICGMNLQEAGDAPRLRHDGSSDTTGGKMANDGVVVAEPGFPAVSLAERERRGHRVMEAHDGFDGYQAIRVEPPKRVYIGASESRKTVRRPDTDGLGTQGL